MYIRHYDATGKQCPAYYVNASRWKTLHDYITQTETKPPEKKPFKFKISTYTDGKKTWFNERKTTGISAYPIRWFACNAAKYRVKTQKNGWLPYVTKYDSSDLENGCAGDGSIITAIEIVDPNGIKF